MQSICSSFLILKRLVECIKPEVQLRHMNLLVEVNASILVPFNLDLGVAYRHQLSVIEAVAHSYFPHRNRWFQPNVNTQGLR